MHIRSLGHNSIAHSVMFHVPPPFSLPNYPIHVYQRHAIRVMALIISTINHFGSRHQIKVRRVVDMWTPNEHFYTIEWTENRKVNQKMKNEGIKWSNRKCNAVAEIIGCEQQKQNRLHKFRFAAILLRMLVEKAIIYVAHDLFAFGESETKSE